MADSLTRSLVLRLVRGRWLLLAVAALLGLLALVPAARLDFDRSIENMFAPSDPLLSPYQKLKRVFGGNEVVLAAYVDPVLMTRKGYARIAKLTDALRAVPGVRSVLSLSGTPLGPAILADTPGSRRVLEMFTGLVVGVDRQTAAVVCILDPTDSATERGGTVAAIRRIAARHDPESVVAGEPVMVVDGFRMIDDDGRRLAWTSLVLLSLTILLLFRSLRWVIVPLAVIELALLLTRAILVVSGLRLSMVSSMLSAIVIVVGVATVVHVIVRFRGARDAGLSPRRAMIVTLRQLVVPVMLACLTDAVGFAALMLSAVGPIHDFGLMMAIGSLLVLVAAAVCVPGLALAGRWDADPKQAWGERGLGAGLERLVDRLLAHPRTLGFVCLGLTAFAAAGSLRLEVETDFTQNFRQGSSLVRSYDLVESRLGGAGVWDAILPAPRELDDAYLNRIRRLARRLRTEVVARDDNAAPRPGLSKVLSIADPLDAMKLSELVEVIPAADLLKTTKLPPALRTAASLGGLDATLKAMPPAALDALMQTIGVERRLELLEQASPRLIESLRGTDPIDGRAYVRVMLRSRERQPAGEKQRLIEQTRRIVAEEFPAGGGAADTTALATPPGEVTGFFVLLTSLIDSMLRDQWVTFGAATVGIGFMMLVAFGSPRLALIALVPNALPILVVTGLLGWVGLRMNMGAAMIAAVSMGLSIDSSIHYLSAFSRARRQGLTTREALHAVHQTVGRAMIFSTAALVVGFTVLVASDFVPTIYFGVLMSLAMLGGLAGNLVILPLLLAWTEPRGHSELAP